MRMDRVQAWADALAGARAMTCMHCGRPTIDMRGSGKTRCSRCGTKEITETDP